MAFIRCSDGSICRDTCDLSLSEQVAELEKQLADAKAKLAAEQKPKTKGEEIADKMVYRESSKFVKIFTPPGIPAASTTLRSLNPESQPCVDNVKHIIADAIDSAIADAKAEQRESDAASLEYVAKAYRNHKPFGHHYDEAEIASILECRASDIRSFLK